MPKRHLKDELTNRLETFPKGMGLDFLLDLVINSDLALQSRRS